MRYREWFDMYWPHIGIIICMVFIMSVVIFSTPPKKMCANCNKETEFMVIKTGYRCKTVKCKKCGQANEVITDEEDL